MFETIHLDRGSSRAEIAARLALTPAAVSYIVAELLDAGFVRESGRRSGGRGQPAIELCVNADAAWTLGLHLDHRRVSGCVADLGGSVSARRHRTLPPEASPSQVRRLLLEVAEALLETREEGRPLGVGLAAVGPLDLARGAVVESELTRSWANEPLRDPLAESLGLDVSMENNVTAAAIGEFWHGRGRAYRNFLVIGFFSAGLGGGLFLERRVYRGSGPNVAEFGHMLVAAPARARSDSRRTSKHDAGSGKQHATRQDNRQDNRHDTQQDTRHERRHDGRRDREPLDVETPVHLQSLASLDALHRELGPLAPEELDERLSAGDAALQAWMHDAATALSQAIVSVDHLLDLDAIVLTGQLPQAMLQALIEQIAMLREPLYMQGWHHRPELLVGGNGAESVLLGAATLPVYDVLVPVGNPRMSVAATAQSAGKPA